MPELTTSAPASLPRADSTRLTGVQVAERLNVPASTWRSYVAPGQGPAADGRFDARTPWWHSRTSRPGPQVLKLPGLRRVRPEPGRRHPRAALRPTAPVPGRG
jgi:hypothetical protein